MRALIGLIGLALLINSGAMAQQLAPTPKRSPRTPVKSQNLVNNGKQIPSSRRLQGNASIIDTRTIKLQGYDLRLFGIVPPFLAASYGPQARAVMDSLTQGSTTCKILDRQRDGHYLARCHNGQNQDFGLELLRRGLAVTARGSLKQTDIERNYIAAEQTAQTTRLGLWSTSVPNAASSRSIQNHATKMVQAKIAERKAKKERAKLKEERAKLEQAKKELAAQEEALKTETQTSVSLDTGNVTATPVVEATTNITNAAPLSANEIIAALSEPPLTQPNVAMSALPQVAAEGSVWERFQLMITGLLILGAALIVVTMTSVQRSFSRREEVRSVAAALRGELMAARSICKARLSKIEDQQSEDDVAWPRLRTLVFQAYVGRLGDLGAELSRQIASIYGQASDYSSYYRSHDGKDAASKHRALEALVHHIDEVNPRLARIEQTGQFVAAPIKATYSRLRVTESRIHKLSLPQTPRVAKPEEADQEEPQGEPKEDCIQSASKPEEEAIEAATLTLSKEMADSLYLVKKEIESKTVKAKTPKVEAKKKKTSKRSKKKKQKKAVLQSVKKETADTMINFAAPLFQKMSELKDKATSHLDFPHVASDDFDVPDYANLSEADIEKILYTEEKSASIVKSPKSKKAG